MKSEITRRGYLAVWVVVLLFAVTVGAAAQTTTLTFAVNNPVAALDQAAEEFEATHPGVEIEFVYQAGIVDDGAHAFTSKVLTMIAAGTPPDIVWTGGHVLTQFAYQGLLLPLDSYLDKWNVNAADFVPPAWQQTVWDGHVYALPTLVDANFALIWNKQLFAEAGLDAEAPPATLADYEEYFQRLTKRDGEGAITQIGARPWDVYGGANTLFTWSWVFGGDFFDYATNDVTAAHPQNVEALEWVHDYQERYEPYLRGTTFEDGTEAMRFVTAGWLKGLQAPIEVGAGYQPYKEGTGRPNPSWIGGWTAAITKDSKHPDLAWEFLHYITATEQGTRLPLPAYLRSPLVEEMLADPVMSVYMDIAQNARYMRPAMPASASYITMLDQAFNEVARGNQQPREALLFVEDQIQTKLDSMLADKE